MAVEARSSFRRRYSLASLIAVAFAAVALVNTPTADSSPWRSCGDQKGRGAGYYNVYARSVSCRKAKKVAYEWFWGGGWIKGESRGFSCSSKRIGIESSRVKCFNFLGDGVWQIVKFQAGA
jgi:hypothetical protein